MHKLIFTVLMAVTAGSCDAITFVAAKGIFSAHMTGNLILLANDLVVRSDAHGWLRMLPFPVFILAACLGGLLSTKPSRECWFLLLETGTLIAAAGFAYAFTGERNGMAIVLLATFAMGLQNAFQRTFAPRFYGTTTMMTGNIVQSFVDIGLLLSLQDRRAVDRLKIEIWVVAGFFFGCLTGVGLASRIQLVALLFSALASLTAYLVLLSGSGAKSRYHVPGRP